jgi:hypothetical protein
MEVVIAYKTISHSLLIEKNSMRSATSPRSGNGTFYAMFSTCITIVFMLPTEAVSIIYVFRFY